MLSFGNKEFRNLQEQVLQNARDIATLKGRQLLRVVIVDELPEVGNPSYIYLVPNDGEEELDLYEEYIWLEDEERYEQIGGVSIDLAKIVTTDTDQEITGTKTFTGLIIVGAANYVIKKDGTKLVIEADGNAVEIKGNPIPSATATYDLGSSSIRWKTLYVSDYVDFGNNVSISKDSSNRLNLNAGNVARIKVGTENSTYCTANWTPDQNNTYNLGRSGSQWKDAYIAGYISDGVNSVTVANISTKVTSAYASGTFDANGEDTIDISDGTPEGLFIFNCGNCQTMLHLTATMVQNAELTPIRVPAVYINNSNPAVGWLNISKSGNTLTLYLGGGLTHIDSGYAWTLTRTNLL